MKHIVIILAALCAAASTHAQKNSILLYGRGDISTASEKDSAGNKNTDLGFHVAPAVGYWFTDHLAAGVLLGISSLTQNYSDEVTGNKSKLHYSTLELGAFVRYRQPLNTLFFVQGDLYGVHATSKTKVNDTLERKGLNGYTIALMPALGLNITPTSAVTLALGSLYYSSTTNPLLKTTNSGLHADFGELISIGFQKNFPLKGRKTALPKG